MSEVVTPYKTTHSKKQQVSEMFNNIAHRYDFLNHFLSAGIDKGWRRKAIKALGIKTADSILDVATGTGDLAIEVASQIDVRNIIGVDISAGMLDIARQKIETLQLQDKIKFQLEDSEELSFADNTFDAITVAFGVRNFEHLEKGLAEMHRVLKAGGKIMILEFSQPQTFPIKQLYRLYSFTILPLLGRLISKDAGAYSYLPESVSHFPYGQYFLTILRSVGFKQVSFKPFTFGIATCYIAQK